MNKPNIFMYVVDQMRADSLHHLGCEASQTPNLDQLAKEGVSFSNAFCQNPVCVPSRCSFMTGWYSHTKGHRTMNFCLEPGDPNLLLELKEAGYHVYWLGRNHFIPADQQERIMECCDYRFLGSEMTTASIHGFTGKSPEEIKEDEDYYSFYKGKMSQKEADDQLDHVLSRHAVELIRSGQLKEPFCLYIAGILPHPPYEVEEPWYSLIDREKIRLPRPSISGLKDKASMLYGIYGRCNMQNYSLEKFQNLRGVYLGMVTCVDQLFGNIVDALKQEKLYDSTNIVFFSDHGDYTGDYGLTEKSQNTFEDPLTNVPLIIKPAKGIAVKPRITPALTELIDIGQTLADLGGTTLKHTQFGKSLRNVLAGEDDNRDAVFCEGGRIHGETQAMETLRSPDSIYWPRIKTQNEEGPQHTKAVMERNLKYKYIYRLYEKDEFYDLEQDPEECRNEIENPCYSGIVAEMKERMLRFLVETGDFVPNRKDRTR